MTPLKAGRALAEDMKCDVTVVEGHGHMLPLEAPKETLAAIKDFIEVVEKQRAAV
jgi:pimeloyl-ACP methyl ester carboxylesterase